jgi:hydrogenase expression/formation protein HypC
MHMGKVSFGGITKEVCFAYTPDVEVGDFVVVHVGFAISKIDEEQAREVFRYLQEMGELEELEVPQPDGDAAQPATASPAMPTRGGGS